ncbi:transcriptional antiterminator NusG [Natranaerovirga hydrolytica]|uniref:Transcription termination/antitermination protein NusG n=1 Tax=Natranaerovirga hydrolytica TaxID=680378 RepID=A0A4R1MRC8_9FIRM|nr:antiterminator LoaP [Natranaerovirga hydrolytica]TCK93129.1 transcriptional antiterminator NusG [Natranaerovirga hydrolytica]
MKKEKWYALFVESNKEKKVKQLLEKTMAQDYKIIIPTRELKERKNGKWYHKKRKLFPGYVLIKGYIDTQAYHDIKNTPGIVEVLKTNEELLTIDEKELEVLKLLIDNKDNNIGVSKLYKEDDTIQIIEGPLKGLEGYIVHVNHRKGRAKVKINFMNDERIVELGVEIVEKIQSQT